MFKAIRPSSSYDGCAAVELRVYTVQWGDAALPTIKNTTKKPLNIPLPGGKRLFLGPGKEGKIRARAAEHPPVAALVEKYARHSSLEKNALGGDDSRIQEKKGLG